MSGEKGATHQQTEAKSHPLSCKLRDSPHIRQAQFRAQEVEQFMTEYWIIAVAYSEEEQHISWVMLTRAVNGKPEKAWLVDRDYVADLINTGSATFKTATLNRHTKKFEARANVHVYDETFLSTDGNDTELDNLNSLPRFTAPIEEVDLKELF